jgi:hypothetical protein
LGYVEETSFSPSTQDSRARLRAVAFCRALTESLNALGMGKLGNSSPTGIYFGVSLFALTLTTYLLVSGSNETVQKFATGTIGTVIGYWLR